MAQRIVAMWSGPRNISTALMRSWSSRADTRVIDEPFYAHYLQQTGYAHPAAQAIIEHYETDWREVARQLLADEGSESIFYQKHMTQHMLEHIDRSWLLKVSNCFLIRDPRRMLKSFAKVIPNPRLDQTGLPQQLALFDYVCAAGGQVPPVLRARDVLLDPEGCLRRLCHALDLPFDPAMLAWPPGPQPSDGIWGEHWYGSVIKSSGFAPYSEDDTPLPAHLSELLEQCQALYDQMARHCISEAA